MLAILEKSLQAYEDSTRALDTCSSEIRQVEAAKSQIKAEESQHGEIDILKSKLARLQHEHWEFYDTISCFEPKIPVSNQSHVRHHRSESLARFDDQESTQGNDSSSYQMKISNDSNNSIYEPPGVSGRDDSPPPASCRPRIPDLHPKGKKNRVKTR